MSKQEQEPGPIEELIKRLDFWSRAFTVTANVVQSHSGEQAFSSNDGSKLHGVSFGFRAAAKELWNLERQMKHDESAKKAPQD